ncbi:MAG: hypothetical protein WAS33_11380 [Candidatus Promineifilaceae bacterium]
MSIQMFQHLVDTLRQPSSPAVAKLHWPYPLPESEMSDRYGLRPLTPTEQQQFPGLRLVLRIDKVCLTQPPASAPKARAGWVVWLAETYPGCYLVRLPGGATLPVPYNEMSWTTVADDVPVTTLATAQAMAQHRHWQTAVLHRLRQTLQL